MSTLISITSKINLTLSIIVAILYILLAVASAIHVLLHKKNIRACIGWIALIFLSPFVGTLLYILLGINRVQRKGSKLRSKGFFLKKLTKKEKTELFLNMPLEQKQFLKFGYNVYKQNFCDGNTVEPLQNGNKAYPKMIESIKSARKEVLIESYIFDSDEETDKFIEAFNTAISNGAKIKVIIDAIGTLKFFRRTIEAKLSQIKGLEYAVFLPPHIPIAFPFINLRNHRKIMIIDGKTAYFGGMNLSKNNVNIDDKKNGVLDMTFKVCGDVVDQMSQIFEDDWFFVTGKQFVSHSKSVKSMKPGKVLARVISDGPDKDGGRIEMLIHGRINFAKKKISILTPYFLPEDNILTSLEIMAMRGVEVEIIIPQKCDHVFMDWAHEPNFKRLLEKGIKIYRTPRPFDHSKICVIDDEWSFIGSANWDVRSFRLHFESIMEVIDKNFAKQLLEIIEAKKSCAKPVLLEDIEKTNIFVRIRNNACRLFTPYF